MSEENYNVVSLVDKEVTYARRHHLFSGAFINMRLYLGVFGAIVLLWISELCNALCWKGWASQQR